MTNDVSTNEDNFNERRIFPRFYPQQRVQVALNSLGADEVYSQLTCLDISEAGVQISCPRHRQLPFRDNSLIEVRLPADDEHITFLARLQRVREDDEQQLLALRIVQIGVRDKELLRHLLHSRTVFVNH